MSTPLLRLPPQACCSTLVTLRHRWEPEGVQWRNQAPCKLLFSNISWLFDSQWQWCWLSRPSCTGSKAISHQSAVTASSFGRSAWRELCPFLSFYCLSFHRSFSAIWNSQLTDDLRHFTFLLRLVLSFFKNELLSILQLYWIRLKDLNETTANMYKI